MDIKHFYIEKGEGEPLILLHGNGENCEYFEHQIETFSNKYHVYAIDTRGQGKTPRGDKEFSIRQFADDLAGFMDEHNIKKSHLLGFSDGGNIALTFSLKYPELVDKLILNGANLNASGVKRKVQIPIEIGYRIAKFFSKKDPNALRKAELLGLMVNDPNIDPNDLLKIKSKTLVIVGDDDMIKDGHSRLIASKIPDAEFVVIKGNHFIANENPNDFNEKVVEFLKK